MENENLTKIPKKVMNKITSFRNQSLLSLNLIQPNFFPNVKSITSWEELVCLGYNPERSRIEAIVNIKKSSGYSGRMCSKGSPEYVRFFADFHDGNGFQDIGMTSFRAFDISDAPAGPQHPISYMVSMKLDDNRKRRFCQNEVLVSLRGVLSWNSIPSTDPDKNPSYGNKLDAKAVLKPLKLQFPGFTLPQVETLNELKPKLDVPKIELSSFVKQNLEKGVSSSRTVAQLDAINKSGNVSFINDLKNTNLFDLGIEFDNLVEDLEQQDFNTTYEQIICVGMNTQQDTLGAVINIKRPFGYGGNLCGKGSLEYVSFFADFNNNGNFEKYLGTTHVNVNDIKSIPEEGLNYAVFLETDLSKYIKVCKIPQIVRIRAVLSWATPPSQNPEQQVTWGNQMDSLVQLRPKKLNNEAQIFSIGDVIFNDISETTGLAFPGPHDPKNNRPWGSKITIKGKIGNSGQSGPIRYRVEYSEDDTTYHPVTLKQQVRIFGSLADPNPILEGPDGWLPYKAVNGVSIDDNVLADWYSHGFDGKYYIRLSYTYSNPITNPSSIRHTESIMIQLDNIRFKTDNTPNNTIDAEFDVDMKIDGGVCKVYDQESKFTGEIKVRDKYFAKYDMSIQPATQIIDTNDLIVITKKEIDTFPGDNINYQGPFRDEFEVDTSKLEKCGYTLRLTGYERTIRNNNLTFPHASKFIGFSVM